MSDLPSPSSKELLHLVPGTSARVVYTILYEHRETGVTMTELRRLAKPLLAELGVQETQEQLDRRKRDLHELFIIDKIGSGKDTRHRLVERRETPRHTRGTISARVRAIVLQPQRCAMCGKTPLDDEVKLVPDHKLPLEWGGTDDIENLQPLCEECNAGKKAHFATYDEYTDKIRQATSYDEPQRRIGELLKAFDGGWVPTDLVGIVASSGQYQEDYQRRIRDLRTLGWGIEVEKRKEGKRFRTFYRATSWNPWPEEIRGEITRIEREKKN